MILATTVAHVISKDIGDNVMSYERALTRYHSLR